MTSGSDLTRRAFLGLAAILLSQLQRSEAAESSKKESRRSETGKPVIHDNDGNVDDIIGTLLVWLSPELSLKAITVNDGDCFPKQSGEAMKKIARYLGFDHTPIAWNETPCPNAFPEKWREFATKINDLPLINKGSHHSTGKLQNTHKLVSGILSCSQQKVSLLCTGPLTGLAPVFEQRPDLKEKVEHCYIMGGAVSVKGNVEMPGHDGSAEWNFYADPPAACKFFETGLPITLVPLDVTDKVPVTKDFLERLSKQTEKSRSSLLAYHLFELLQEYLKSFFFWDVLTVACMIRPDLFKFENKQLKVITSGKSQGRTLIAAGGKDIRVATSVNVESFEKLVLDILKTQ